MRSFSVIPSIWPCILFHESMALTVTEICPEIVSPKSFFDENGLSSHKMYCIGYKAGKNRFFGTQKSVLLKASSGEH